MSLEAGRLRHRVRIERFDYLRDTNGDAVQDPNTGEIARDWIEVATVWAAVEPLSVKEFIQSQATQSHVKARIVIRQRDDVDAGMRAVHLRTGRTPVVYNIEGVLHDPDSGLEYSTLPCSQGVNQGE